jgi:hypothetical protein
VSSTTSTGSLIVANLHHRQHPIPAQRDRVARSHVRHGNRDRRRQDLHIVLRAGRKHMIAEARAWSCTRKATIYRRRQMARARQAVRICRSARVTGVAFFDFKARPVLLRTRSNSIRFSDSLAWRRGYPHGAVRSPTNHGRENRMAFTFRLEHEDGSPADPAGASDGRTDVAGKRHDPARPEQDASRRRDAVRG